MINPQCINKHKEDCLCYIPDTIHCNHCSTIANSMRKCNVCHKYMCNLCFTEKTEEDAIKNGAKNWIKRKNSLFTCFKHNSFCIKPQKNNYQFEFGSLLEWIPILEHDDSHYMLLCNMCPKSNNYHKVAILATDSHSRTGYFLMEKSLSDMLIELRSLKGTEKSLVDKPSYLWDGTSVSPLFEVLYNRDLPTYYG